VISGHGGDLYFFSSRCTLFFGGRAGKIGREQNREWILEVMMGLP
jgi:hypothetical protein